MAKHPWRDDDATIPCPLCARPFAASGRRRFCSDACRRRAWAHRHRQPQPPPIVIPPRRRRPITIYECDTCGHRALGEQRCDACATFMRRIGYGGCCPHCDEPVAVTDLLDNNNPPSDR